MVWRDETMFHKKSTSEHGVKTPVNVDLPEIHSVEKCCNRGNHVTLEPSILRFISVSHVLNKQDINS